MITNLKRITPIIMENSEKATKILQLIAEKADCEIDEIKNTSTWADIGLDSLDTVELIMQLEDTFHIQIPEEDSATLNTVGDAIAYVEKH